MWFLYCLELFWYFKNFKLEILFESVKKSYFRSYMEIKIVEFQMLQKVKKKISNIYRKL